jgi:peptidoglycan/xylan/chitin deacetylase (PgdA/CDA1 family)
MQFAPLYPFIYQALNPLFPSCLWAGNAALPTISLTFDDGPHPVYTPQLLEVLDHYGVPASFFWLGECVHRAPAIAQTVYQQQHWLGLHGYEHHSFPTLSPVALKQSLLTTQAEIASACNLVIDAIRDVRPPNGLFIPQTLKLLQEWNYRPVMWSVVPEDWVNPGPAIVVERILAQVRGGSIIVLHDGVCGGADVAQTVKSLIPALLERGYRFVTIDQLWQQRSALNLKEHP